MANGVLLASTLCCGALHLWALISFDTFTATTTWACIILGGIVTSVWNHATTSLLAKWFDRCTIAACVGLDAFILAAATTTDGRFSRRCSNRSSALMASGGCYTTLLAAVGLYFAAKSYEHKCQTRRDVCHAGSHVLATILHVSMATLIVIPQAVEEAGMGGERQ
ncbi:hypothetical protein VYU27_007509 [Nannochloropsis oceanica]